MVQGTIIVDRWAQQMDGRLVYQHIIIFEPELKALHFQRLARLCRTGLISTRALTILARAGLRERATAFLLEQTAHENSSRTLCDTLLAALETTNFPPALEASNTQVMVQPSSNVSFVRDELAAVSMQFLPDLVAGLYLTVPYDDAKAVEAFSSADAACAAVCVILPECDAEANRVIRACGRTLLTSWDAAESATLRNAGVAVTNPRGIDRTFANFVEAEFERRCGRPDNSQTATSLPLVLPRTPFCRDAMRAWDPSADRSATVVGARVNHLTSLDDIVSVAG